MAEEEAKLSANSIKNNDMEMEDEDEGENKEFYEDIEAPKFVDFTVPDHYCPDDRYWFCFRVGCDQKHEEEMDPEAIYKNFVLRVMAARSPNVKLHKALNRNCLSKNMKCPLSAPPKSSKSRLSRLAIISSISQKIGDDKEKAKLLPKVNSTPKAKGKQVASKYLTTPRNKNCIQNQNAFRSVQNPNPPSVAVPKSRMVAKALIFHSPKKVNNLKKSVELRTPLTKLCEGMKKLEITSRRKPVLGCSMKQSKQIGYSSTRERGYNKERCRTKISQMLHTQLDQDAKYLGSLKCKKSKGKLSMQSSIKEIPCAREIKAKSRDDDKEHRVEEAACPISSVPPVIELASSDALEGELNNTSDSRPTNMEGNDLSSLQPSNNEDGAIQENVQEHSGIKEVALGNGENLNNVLLEDGTSLGTKHESESLQPSNNEDGAIQENAQEHIGIKEETLGNGEDLNNVLLEDGTLLATGHESEIAHSNDKENASAFDENKSCNQKRDYSVRKILLGIQTSDRKKVMEAVNKDLKGHATIGAPGMKSMKLKPTNPKPFRLRTDERGILRESNLERKNHTISPQKEAGDKKSLHVDIQKGIASLKPTKTPQVRPAGLCGRAQHPKHQELKPESHTSQESNYDLKKIKSSLSHVLQLQRHLSVATEAMTPDKPLSVIVETSSGNSKPKEVGKPCQKGTITTAVRLRAPASSRSSSRGRRLVTIPKEPNFHRFLMPKSCAAKIS